MTYLYRSLEKKFMRMSDFFKAVLVTGARQVGKTTMLKNLGEKRKMTYVTLDDIMARNLAKSDPIMFFQTYKPPMIIDEIQYAPQLLSEIKIICDESEETGLFWLTGSQKFEMMRNVQETLAGRIGILELYSLTAGEIDDIAFDGNLDFSLACFQERQKLAPKNDIMHVFEHIWRGGMPQILHASNEQRNEYFNSYVGTYIINDAVEFGGISNTSRFSAFIAACAALISEQVNYKTLSDIAGISQVTAKEWLRVLEGLGIIFLLKPYANNELKRLAKTPKLYFCDTGLAAYLTKWSSTDTLLNGAASGRFFENFVVAELIKHYAYSRERAEVTYYRDSNAKEIDLLIEREGFIHPLEIKQSASPDSRAIRKFDIPSSSVSKRGTGGIICMCREVMAIDDKNCYIPCNLVC